MSKRGTQKEPGGWCTCEKARMNEWMDGDGPTTAHHKEQGKMDNERRGGGGQEKRSVMPKIKKNKK